MSRQPKWRNAQLRSDLHHKIKVLAFPEPQLEIRTVLSAIIEDALKDEEKCRRICSDLRKQLCPTIAQT